MNVSDVMTRFYLGKEWIVGDTYESLTWNDDDLKPTEKELKNKWELLLVERKAVKYKSLRKKEYPSIVDQLDMLYHAMENGEIPVAIEFRDSLKEIKLKYPKP